VAVRELDQRRDPRGEDEQEGRLACSQHGWLSRRGRGPKRGRSPASGDHGDSTTRRFDAPLGVATEGRLVPMVMETARSLYLRRAAITHDSLCRCGCPDRGHALVNCNHSDSIKEEVAAPRHHSADLNSLGQSQSMQSAEPDRCVTEVALRLGDVVRGVGRRGGDAVDEDRRHQEGAAWVGVAAAPQYLCLEQNRRYIGQSQSQRPPTICMS
jgi:hypothetical protein